MRGCIATLLLLVTLSCQAATVLVEHAWVAEAPPSLPVNAAYLSIENTGADAATLIAIASPDYPRIEMHRSVSEGMTTSMQPVDRLVIEPGTTVTFAPGGLHLMIYNTGKPPRSGETVPLSLHFADGTTSYIDADVRTMTDHQTHHKQHHTEDGVPPDRWSGLAVSWQYLLPQHMLSSMMYRLTRSEWAPLKNLLISNFIRLYDVDMSIAVHPQPADYRHFNAFFTRALKPEARPLDPAPDALVSPVDGAVSQSGRIHDGRLLQAKGHEFTATALLGGDPQLAQRFHNGDFVTIYLSPRDYHRIHMPLDGTLDSMTYIPGDLFSVNPATTRGIDRLFARNERVVQVFDTPIGKVALVMVGAIFVGSMETVWAGEITPARNRQTYTINYRDGERVRLQKGAEMGRFNMGSTVILLFEQGRIEPETLVRPNAALKLGQRIATLK